MSAIKKFFLKLAELFLEYCLGYLLNIFGSLAPKVLPPLLPPVLAVLVAKLELIPLAVEGADELGLKRAEALLIETNTSATLLGLFAAIVFWILIRRKKVALVYHEIDPLRAWFWLIAAVGLILSIAVSGLILEVSGRNLQVLRFGDMSVQEHIALVWVFLIQGIVYIAMFCGCLYVSLPAAVRVALQPPYVFRPVFRRINAFSAGRL